MSEEILSIISQWEEYLLYQRNYSKNTVSGYLKDLDNLLIFIQKYYSSPVSLKLLDSIDIRCVRSWLADKSNSVCAKSSMRALSAVKNFCKFLDKKYQIRIDVIFSIKISTKTRDLHKSLTREEVDISLSKIYDMDETGWVAMRNKALLTLIYATGLRISEALSLTKKDLRNETLVILGKGGRERMLPWIGKVKDLIEKYLELLPFQIEMSDMIFLGKRGLPLQRASFSRELIKLRRAIGLPESLTAHSFRHSFASHMLENGADLRSIQELLGHKNLSTTQRYTKINKAYLESVYDKTHPNSFSGKDSI